MRIVVFGSVYWGPPHLGIESIISNVSGRVYQAPFGVWFGGDLIFEISRSVSGAPKSQGCFGTLPKYVDCNLFSGRKELNFQPCMAHERLL